MALLVLADGTTFYGRPLGFSGDACGEVVFNTAMTGYQEVLTDPSYRGQMVVMTCSHIGNYGTTPEDDESRAVWLGGFIVRETVTEPSNWRSEESLHAYLTRHRVVGIEGIDTRALTRHLRDHGSQAGVISHTERNPDVLAQQAQQVPSNVGRDLVAEVSCHEPYTWSRGTGVWPTEIYPEDAQVRQTDTRWKIVVMDFGVKRNILRRLIDVGCQVEVVPASTPHEDIRARKPHGIFLSNGPGDPEGVPYAVSTIRDLLGWRPIVGICLGHQILALALGMPTHKLKFGHHGANHPVSDLRTQRVEITSQNHNFAVDMPPDATAANSDRALVSSQWGEVEITHRSLNDGCCEGMIGRDVPLLSVQYHPEAAPGPHDSGDLFQQFVRMLEAHHG